jgi:hypothetical protein
MKNRQQDEINTLVRSLSRAGHSDDFIAEAMADSIKAAIRDRQWSKPWMTAMQATLARIKSEGSRALIHN